MDPQSLIVIDPWSTAGTYGLLNPLVLLKGTFLE